MELVFKPMRQPLNCGRQGQQAFFAYEIPRLALDVSLVSPYFFAICMLLDLLPAVLGVPELVEVVDADLVNGSLGAEASEPAGVRAAVHQIFFAHKRALVANAYFLNARDVLDLLELGLQDVLRLALTFVYKLKDRCLLFGWLLQLLGQLEVALDDDADKLDLLALTVDRLAPGVGELLQLSDDPLDFMLLDALEEGDVGEKVKQLHLLALCHLLSAFVEVGAVEGRKHHFGFANDGGHAFGVFVDKSEFAERGSLVEVARFVEVLAVHVHKVLLENVKAVFWDRLLGAEQARQHFFNNFTVLTLHRVRLVFVSL